MSFLFITISDPSPASQANLQALLDSLGRQAIRGELVLGMRGGVRQLGGLPDNVRVHQIELPRVISLSRARNVALRFVSEHGLLAASDVVAFPDDDNRYPDALLARVAELVGPEREIVCVPYAPSPSPEAIDRLRFPREDRRLTSSFVMRVVASGTIFVASSVAAAVGDFDETLGLGARYGASEDADYVLRALSLGARGEYRGTSLLVEHPYKPRRADQYYLGNVAALAKHVACDHSALPSLLFRLAVGAALACRRRISIREYGRAIGAAIRLLVPTSGRGSAQPSSATTGISSTARWSRRIS